jgi:hypothetical protein
VGNNKLQKDIVGNSCLMEPFLLQSSSEVALENALVARVRKRPNKFRFTSLKNICFVAWNYDLPTFSSALNIKNLVLDEH